MKQRRGNVEKISKEICEQIEGIMRIGVSCEGAAVQIGISIRTLYRWMKQGNVDRKQFRLKNIKKPTLYMALNDSIARGTEQFKTRHLQNIDKCSMGIDGEYMTYPKGARDPETGEDLSGQYVMVNGRPQWKRIPQQADGRLSLQLLEKLDRTRFGADKGDADAKKGARGTDPSAAKVIVYIPSNGKEAPGTKLHQGGAVFPDSLSDEEDEAEEDEDDGDLD